MKVFEREVYNILTAQDIEQLVRDIHKVYPETMTKNVYKEHLDPELSYLNFIPQQVFGFERLLNGPILLNYFDTYNTQDLERKVDIHEDSPATDQVTVLFYPQVDSEGGGEFFTEHRSVQVQEGMFIVFPSNELHGFNEYVGTRARISIKWMYGTTTEQAQSYRDSSSPT